LFVSLGRVQNLVSFKKKHPHTDTNTLVASTHKPTFGEDSVFCSVKMESGTLWQRGCSQSSTEWSAKGEKQSSRNVCITSHTHCESYSMVLGV